MDLREGAGQGEGLDLKEHEEFEGGVKYEGTGWTSGKGRGWRSWRA